MTREWYAYILYLSIAGDLNDNDLESLYDHMECDGFLDENHEWISSAINVESEE